MVESPLAIAEAAALQVCPESVQLSVVAAHGGGATSQSDPACSTHDPLVHANVAVPVAGAVLSTRSDVCPLAIAETGDVHVFAPTVQFTLPAAHGDAGGTAVGSQVPDWKMNMPAVQRKTASPVVGGFESVMVPVGNPSSVAGAVALQVFPEIVQFTELAAQSVVELGGVAVPASTHWISVIWSWTATSIATWPGGHISGVPGRCCVLPAPICMFEHGTETMLPPGAAAVPVPEQDALV